MNYRVMSARRAGRAFFAVVASIATILVASSSFAAGRDSVTTAQFTMGPAIRGTLKVKVADVTTRPKKGEPFGVVGAPINIKSRRWERSVKVPEAASADGARIPRGITLDFVQDRKHYLYLPYNPTQARASNGRFLATGITGEAAVTAAPGIVQPTRGKLSQLVTFSGARRAPLDPEMRSGGVLMKGNGDGSWVTVSGATPAMTENGTEIKTPIVTTDGYGKYYLYVPYSALLSAPSASAKRH